MLAAMAIMPFLLGLAFIGIGHFSQDDDEAEDPLGPAMPEEEIDQGAGPGPDLGQDPQQGDGDEVETGDPLSLALGDGHDVALNQGLLTEDLAADLRALLASGELAEYDVNLTEIPGEGDHIIDGGAGDDLIVDLSGADSLFGGAGDDILAALDLNGADAPDLLDGGPGDDILIGDDGDVMTGGAGWDSFAVVSNDAADQPVTITDIEDDELLILAVDHAPTGAPALARLAANGEDLEITVEDRVIAILQGRTEIGGIEVVVENLQTALEEASAERGVPVEIRQLLREAILA